MIREFYRNRTLLLTGSTGFLGQVLAAKMLRDLPQIRRIYALVRPSRRPEGHVVSPAERLEKEFLSSSVFASFRAADPQAFAAAVKKVVPVGGDLSLPGLGLEKEVREELLDQVEIVVNSAAGVDFTAPLDGALKLNAQGPLEVLELARQSRRRAVYVHVSTAYVNGQLKGRIPDETLPPDRSIRQMMKGGTPSRPFDPEAELEACKAFCDQVYQQAHGKARQADFRRAILAQRRSRNLSEKRLEQLLQDRCRRWIEQALVREGKRRARAHGWNDIYSFTKALAEQMLVKKRGEVPLVVVRPSIIESTLADPEPGWITGLKVTDPLIVAYGRGLMPDFPAQPDLVLDLVPADMVANVVIAAAVRATREEMRVFHVATSAENPVCIATLVDYIHGYFEKHPMRDRDGSAPSLPQFSFPSVRKFRLWFSLKYVLPVTLYAWLLERLPAAWVPPQKKRLLGALKVRLKRVLHYTEIYHPYTNLHCSFENGRTRALFASLSAAERRLFDMDVGRIDWAEYIQRIHIPGLRRHVLRDGTGGEALFREAPEEASVEEERWQAEAEIETLVDLLKWACGRYAHNVALQMQRRGEWVRYTYGQVQERVDALAHYWQERGLSSGQRVLLFAGSCPEWALSYMAASTLALVVVPLGPRTREEEVWKLVSFVEARALIASEECFALLSKDKIAAHSAGEQALCFFNLDRGGLPFGQDGQETRCLPAAVPRPVRVTPEMPASILFTAAAVPRGVVLSHRNFISDLLALAEVQRVYESDQMLSVLPLHHGLEFTGGLLMSLWGGASTTYLERVNSREMLAAMRATGTTVLLAAPRLLGVLLKRLQRLDGTPSSLESLRLVVSGGAPLAGELYDQYRSLGIEVCEGYGLTEAGPIVAVNPPGRARRGSVGQVLPGQEVSIENPDDRGQGEILVRGPNLSSGYFKRPELSARVLREGWLHSGDIGYMDAEGYLYIAGRCKNLIVTGTGENVYPEEVEKLYAALCGVAELGVVGLYSPRTGSEEIHGVAVLDALGGGDEAELEARVRQHLRHLSRTLPGHQRIQHLHLRRRPLPRRADGEVDRDLLRSEVEGAGKSSGHPGLLAPQDEAAGRPHAGEQRN